MVGRGSQPEPMRSVQKKAPVTAGEQVMSVLKKIKLADEDEKKEDASAEAQVQPAAEES